MPGPAAAVGWIAFTEAATTAFTSLTDALAEISRNKTLRVELRERGKTARLLITSMAESVRAGSQLAHGEVEEIRKAVFALALEPEVPAAVRTDLIELYKFTFDRAMQASRDNTAAWTQFAAAVVQGNTPRAVEPGSEPARHLRAV